MCKKELSETCMISQCAVIGPPIILNYVDTLSNNNNNNIFIAFKTKSTVVKYIHT